MPFLKTEEIRLQLIEELWDCGGYDSLSHTKGFLEKLPEQLKKYVFEKKYTFIGYINMRKQLKTVSPSRNFDLIEGEQVWHDKGKFVLPAVKEYKVDGNVLKKASKHFSVPASDIKVLSELDKDSYVCFEVEIQDIGLFIKNDPSVLYPFLIHLDDIELDNEANVLRITLD